VLQALDELARLQMLADLLFGQQRKLLDVSRDQDVPPGMTLDLRPAAYSLSIVRSSEADGDDR
jgi:hypothetical protein